MRPPVPPAGFRSLGPALLRACAHPDLDVPPLPDLTTGTTAAVTSWVGWLATVWALDGVAEAIEHASPDLAVQVATVRAAEMPPPKTVRRVVLAVARYLMRMRTRPTPFGLMAGVAPVSFGPAPAASWGGKDTAVARASAAWLSAVITALEDCPELLDRLAVVADDTMIVRGDHLVLPFATAAGPAGSATAKETAVRLTSDSILTAVTASSTPVRMSDLAERVRLAHPDIAGKVRSMLTTMVHRRILITNLHAPSTEPDALAHLLRQLAAADADTIPAVAALVGGLRDIGTLMAAHNARPADAPTLRADLAARMRKLADAGGHPLALDLRLDAALVLPEEVARDVERAAWTLARLSPFPFGEPAWRDYHLRFYERYGIGSMVPLAEAVDRDSGVDFPDGFAHTPPARRPALSDRDRALLALAQEAALDGRVEVTLDEALLDALDQSRGELRLPPHLEVGVRVHAADTTALERGQFRVEVESVSRAAGVMTGRFLPVLAPDDQAVLAAALASIPTADDGAVAVQLSFPPLAPSSAHVVRAPQVLPLVLSLSEHRVPDPGVLGVRDVSVACDGYRLYLAVPERGVRIEPTGLHALSLTRHTSPLARFLTRATRSQNTHLATFDWGAAAHLPFLPRLVSGRIVLSAARWRLATEALPGQERPQTEWNTALDSWRTTRHVPARVFLDDAGRRLLLDLDDPGHRALLRAHQRTAADTVLVEAGYVDSTGWCGREHELVVPLAACAPPGWPRLPAPTRARLIDRQQGDTPATSKVLLAKLYGHPDRLDLLLSEHLPRLLARLDPRLRWWFLRFRDPDQHLRLRFALPEPAAFATVAAEVSTWADDLHAQGLLREVTYATSYPETGRWGSGPALTAAEAVFAADSRALLVQLAHRTELDRVALLAANIVSLAAGFSGSVTAGVDWLIRNIPARAPRPVQRPLFDQAVQVASPFDDFAALRAVPGGSIIVDAWRDRDRALTDYRAALSEPGPDTAGINPDDVLGSLMHGHVVRTIGLNLDTEGLAMYLARAAALAHRARTLGGRP